MAEISVNVPDNLKDLLPETGAGVLVEALRSVALRRVSYHRKELSTLKEKIALFEHKYSASYQDFLLNIPDTVVAHDDWIEWTYLIKAEEALSNKIDKLIYLAASE